ncbi:Spc98 family-domain-containing protein [Phlyctochytrium arcticum]|nr:Spc98 family-domain-containing protein [Phlyctochytrium arcticum]
MAPNLRPALADRDTALLKLAGLVLGIDPSSQDAAQKLPSIRKQIQYHNFQTTNEHEIRRRYDGLIEKFTLCGQETKARVLGNGMRHLGLLSASLQLLTFDLLNLFLCLSNDPLRQQYEPSPLSSFKQHTLSWNEIVADDPLWGDHWESESGSETAVDDDWSEEEQSEEDVKVSELDDVKEIVDSPALAVAVKKRQYWTTPTTGNVEAVEYNPVDACSLAPALAFYQSQRSEYMYRPASSTRYVREVDLVRDTLLMLSGRATPVYISTKNGDLVATPNLNVKHLTENALQSLLGWFAEQGSILRKLTEFARRLVISPSNWLGIDDPNPIPDRGESNDLETQPRTLQALEFGLSQYLCEFEAKIADIQTNCAASSPQNPLCAQQQLVSLLALQSRLQGSSDTTREIAEFVQCVKMICSTTSDNAAIASQILDLLYNQMLLHATASSANNQNIFQALLLYTLQPYLESCQQWIEIGEIDDPRGEFFVKYRSASEDWQSRFIMRVDQHGKVLAPRFFQPICDIVLKCGKSVSIIRRLEPSSTLNQTEQVPLFEHFLKGLQRAVPTEDADVTDTQIAASRQTPGLQVNDLFPVAFSAILFGAAASASSSATRVRFQDALVYHHSLENHLASLLRAPIQMQHEKMGRRLTSLLMRRCHLEKHLLALQSVFLFTTGAVMHPFCLNLFEKITTRQLVYEPHVLNSAFDEAACETPVAARGFVSSDFFSFTLKGNSDAVRDLPSELEQLDRIEVIYDLRFPMENLFTLPTFSIYNQFFHILIRVKYALYCLRTEDWSQQRDAKNGALRKMGRVRSAVGMQLRHFLANLQVFFMDAVINPESKVLMERLRLCVGMDEVIELHDKFTRTIRDRCLLNIKASSIWKHMSQPIGLAVQFAQLCRTFDQDFERNLAGPERIQAMGDELARLGDQMRDTTTIVKKTLNGLASHGVWHGKHVIFWPRFSYRSYSSVSL